VIFSTHVIAHAERLCDEVAIIAGGRVPFAGPTRARPHPPASPP
jgi:ABC-2 type transport system ATP-binding protein